MEQALAAETLVLRESLGKLSAAAGAQASQLEGLNRDVQRMKQLESQLAECRGKRPRTRRGRSPRQNCGSTTAGA